MISEQDKQAILRGEYGISRNGLKCKFVDTRNSSNFPYIFAYYDEDGSVTNIFDLTDKLTYFPNTEDRLDIVGLWKDKPTPFDLEKALAGVPVMTRDGSKAYVLSVIEQPKGLEHYRLVGFGCNGEHKEFLHWDETGKVMADDDTCDDIISMWKEPEPESNTVTVTLPCALKEPKDGMWYLAENGVFKSSFGKKIRKDTFERCVYFGAREDAQAWFDAMQNSRQ